MIYVAQPYGGMNPHQMEGFIAYYYEYHFLYISGIEHVESKSIQGVVLIRLEFHPGTNMPQALAETISYVNRAPPSCRPARSRPSSCVSMRHGAGGLAGLHQPHPQRQRTAGSGAVSGASALRHFARCLRAAALRRQPAQHRGEPGSGPSGRLSHVAGRGDYRAGSRQHHRAFRQSAVAGHLADGAHQRRGSDIADLQGVPIRQAGESTVYLRDIGAVADAADLRPAMRWSTASAPSTSPSPSGPTRPRWRWSTW